MNSIASLLFTLAVLSQVGNTGTPPGVKAGWKIETDGSMSYIGQVTPEIAQEMSTLGKEMALDIPDFLQGRVSRVVWRIGSEEVEREPSEAELRAMPNRQVLPPNSGNGLSPGGLTSLSDRSAAITVPIDSPLPSSMTMPALGLGTARATDNDPTLPPVPSLAQSYQSPTARTAQAANADLYRSGLNTAASGPSLGIGPTSSKDTLPPGTNKPVFGPQLPPPGYTGSSITVNGSSTGTGTGSQWNDARNAATAGQYGVTNPLANGTFGTPNSYGTNNFAPNSGNYASLPGSTYGASQNSVYPNTSQAYPNANGYPNTSGQFNSAAQPTYANTYGTNTYGTNTPVRPDAYLASSNNYAAPFAQTSTQQPTYPPPIQAPQTQPAQTWTYPATATNYAAVPNTGLIAPTIPLVASNQPVPTVANRNVVDGTKRTLGSNDDVVYQNVSTTPPSYVVALLLASLVGNFYLVMLLNQLLQRYRSLQASSRGSTSLAI